MTGVCRRPARYSATVLTRWLLSLDRSWKIGIAVALAVIVGLLVWQTKFRGPTGECQPVRAMLDYNTSQLQNLNSKTGKGPNGAPSVADVAAYRAWSDGLADKTQQITGGDVAAHAVQLATLSSQLVGNLDAWRIASQGRAPGAPQPAEYYQFVFVREQMVDQLGALEKACPAHREWFKFW